MFFFWQSNIKRKRRIVGPYAILWQISPSSAHEVERERQRENPRPFLPPKPQQLPMAATAMDHDGGGGGGGDVVTPGELLGNSLTLVAGRGAYADGRSVRASVTGYRRIVPPAPGSDDQVGFVVCSFVWGFRMPCLGTTTCDELARLGCRGLRWRWLGTRLMEPCRNPEASSSPG